MKRIAFILALLACPPGVSSARDDGPDIFGYFEPHFSGLSVKGELIQLSSNKLRVDLARTFGDRVRFEANYDFITYHGATAYNLLDFLASGVRAQAPQELVEAGAFRFPFADRNFLDNANLRIHFDTFDLTLGKQQISPGTGYAWNPTDLFNVKDVLDPAYEQPGHNAIKAIVPMGLHSSLILLYAPGDTFASSAKSLRIKSSAGHFDFSIIAGERNRHETDFRRGTAIDENRRMAGADAAGELLGIGIWLECSRNRMELTRDYSEAVLGADYTFDGGLYLLGELYHNGQGANDMHAYDLNRWMRFYSHEVKVIARDQAYIYCRYPATDLLDVGASLIYAFDNSAAIVPQAVYNAAPNLDLTLFGAVYAGAGGAAYSALQGSGCLLRARYYF